MSKIDQQKNLKELEQALFYNGEQSIDGFVPDVVSASEGRQMMAEAIRAAIPEYARMKRRRFIAQKVSLAAAAILVFSLAATPSGRAFALDVADYVVKIYRDYIVHHSAPESKGISLQETLPEGEYSYPTLQELAKVVGHPLIGLRSRDVVSTDVQFTTSGEMKVADNIVTTYELSSGDKITTVEIVLQDGGEANAKINKLDGSAVQSEKLYNGAEVFAVENEDGVEAYAAWENVSFSVTSDTLPIQKLMEYLRQFQDIK